MQKLKQKVCLRTRKEMQNYCKKRTQDRIYWHLKKHYEGNSVFRRVLFQSQFLCHNSFDLVVPRQNFY
jgi:hypothetical protein